MSNLQWGQHTPERTFSWKRRSESISYHTQLNNKKWWDLISQLRGHPQRRSASFGLRQAGRNYSDTDYLVFMTQAIFEFCWMRQRSVTAATAGTRFWFCVLGEREREARKTVSACVVSSEAWWRHRSFGVDSAKKSKTNGPLKPRGEVFVASFSLTIGNLHVIKEIQGEQSPQCSIWLKRCDYPSHSLLFLDDWILIMVVRVIAWSLSCNINQCLIQ